MPPASQLMTEPRATAQSPWLRKSMAAETAAGGGGSCRPSAASSQRSRWSWAPALAADAGGRARSVQANGAYRRQLYASSFAVSRMGTLRAIWGQDSGTWSMQSSAARFKGQVRTYQRRSNVIQAPRVSEAIVGLLESVCAKTPEVSGFASFLRIGANKCVSLIGYEHSSNLVEFELRRRHSNLQAVGIFGVGRRGVLVFALWCIVLVVIGYLSRKRAINLSAFERDGSCKEQDFILF
jgi:hypothetical protein